MTKLKLGIIGCGYLSNIIVDAYNNGLLKEYELVGVLGRNSKSAKELSQKGKCKLCNNIDELLELKPDHIAEAASGQAVRDYALKILSSNCNFAVLSIGAFADEEFYNKVKSQQDQPDQGELKVSVFTEDGTRPVENALVRISYTGESGQTLEEVRTDSSGQTPILELKTPPLEYSMEPVEEQPYAEYTIQVQAEGFENTEIAGTQVLPGVVAQQSIKMAFQAEASFERLVIGPHTLFAEYPPKIEEAEIKPVNESGEIVLSRVVIPEYIVVHDGSVNDTTAPDYYVRYKDYIKNSNKFYKDINGVKASLKVKGNKVIYTVDIQYDSDYMKDLVEAGLVSTNGSYKDIEYISLQDTLKNQENAGLTCKEK